MSHHMSELQAAMEIAGDVFTGIAPDSEFELVDLEQYPHFTSKLEGFNQFMARNRDPSVESRGSLAFPLTERIASDIMAHGEDWAREYHLSRGVEGWELNILIDGAKRLIANMVSDRMDRADTRWMELDDSVTCRGFVV